MSKVPVPGKDLLSWSTRQGYILTGGQILNGQFKPKEHYSDPEDLPHFQLQRGQEECWRAYEQWRLQGLTSTAVVGAWERPLFAGGWTESTDEDTAAFNLQTPSLFIDIRCPRARPTAALSKAGSLAAMTEDELRALARQHCFSGYTLPVSTGPFKNDNAFARHHAIDWNFHKSFPRPRPNMWRVESSPDGRSFKEHSVARDEFGVPVYFERWERIDGDGAGAKYLAMRRRLGSGDAARVAVLIVVGDFFAYAVDRPQPAPQFAGAQGPGGPALVDQALAAGDRAGAEQYLDLCGMFGRVGGGGGNDPWSILHCTHPWREGSVLLRSGDVRFERVETEKSLGAALWGGAAWDVYDCNFVTSELNSMFGAAATVPSSKM